MTDLIDMATVVLSAVLVLLLFARLLQVDANLKLKKHRAKDAGLADLLIHASVIDDGVVLGKNGSLMASWLYKGEDHASSTPEQRNMVAIRINEAFNRLGNGWMVHVDATRRPAPSYPSEELSHFPDPLTEAMDAERRERFESLGTMYEGYFVLTVTYYPPMLAKQKFIELMFDDDTPATTKSARAQAILDQFKTACSTLQDNLSTVLQMTRLHGNETILENGEVVTHDDFLSWLQFCVSGDAQPIQLPANPSFLDSILGGQELWTGVVPKIGRKFIQVVAIEGFPLESSPGMLNALTELACEYRWSNRIIFMDQHEAVSHLEKYRKLWRQKVRGFFDQVFNLNSGNIDLDAKAMVDDASSSIAEVNSGLVAAGFYTSVVVLMDEDRGVLEASAQRVAAAIKSLGFAARVETINTMDAFLGSIPGHGVENVRRPIVNTLNLAHMLPSSSIWTGSATAPCPMYPAGAPAVMHCVTNGATPFRFNLHVDDVGHLFMVGPTGAGKSVHLAELAAQLRRYAGMTVISFDKGYSMYTLAKGINAASKGKSGLHFNIAGDDSKLAFCPLQFLETKSDRAWAMDWIDTILALNGVVSDTEMRNEIGHAIMTMHNDGSKTLSDFCVTVQNIKVRAALQQYTIEGQMGFLLDAETDGLGMSDFTVFEIEDLMNLGAKWALPVLLYLFRRIEKMLNGQPAALFLDEAWLMLGDEVFKERIREWLKVLRKANCSVIMATQNISDAVNCGIFDVILESTATKIFLPNVHALQEDNKVLYRRMGLNDRQIQIIATAVRKRQYYFASANGHRLYELALSPLELAFVGIAGKDPVASVKQFEAQYGDAWVGEWLRSRGLDATKIGEAA
ncbi:conjugal transfer protein TrbE [Pseudomonas sp. PDM20]|uniref:VirB4 family type IV secretion/conjugal transfer ATPase n=1 Tax=Pseudomonas sp. PDM20 TaxID=2769254 RepID=UPI00177F9EF6|nr:conjugal transfer protein TrbE [Pseudomonas sp. PDM20]MBD9686859.1 conjugal transfer protein TrbE [Pseudomonas sp. PDM20]